MEKKCSKCGEVKSLEEFYNNRTTKDNKSTYCKICLGPSKEQKEKRRKHRQENKELFRQKEREYNQKNKHVRQKHRQENKESIAKYAKEHYQNNKKNHRILADKWYKENIKTNPLYKLKVSIRSNIRTSLKNYGYSKNTKTFNILKCEFNFFIEFLNGIASNGYTFGIGNLHLDHVIPISLAQTEDEILLLCHYSNYQLLTAEENMAKSNRYVNPLNLARVLEHHPNPDKIREIHAML